MKHKMKIRIAPHTTVVCNAYNGAYFTLSCSITPKPKRCGTQLNYFLQTVRLSTGKQSSVSLHRLLRADHIRIVIVSFVIPEEFLYDAGFCAIKPRLIDRNVYFITVQIIQSIFLSESNEFHFHITGGNFLVVITHDWMTS